MRIDNMWESFEGVPSRRGICNFTQGRLTEFVLFFHNENKHGVVYHGLNRFQFWQKLVSVFFAQMLFIGLAQSSDMNEAQLVKKTRELSLAVGNFKLVENIESCQKGDANSCFVLGVAFVFSHGVKKDISIGIAWETKAAVLGNSDAQYNLSVEYRDGVSVEKNIEKGIYWERLAAENGHRVAMYNLGAAACDGQVKNMTCMDGVKFFQRSAQKGFALANTTLGLMHLRGQIVNMDYPTARSYLEEGMRLGDPDAYCWTGYIHCRGIGVDIDCVKGGALIRKAASMGSAECAKLNL